MNKYRNVRCEYNGLKFDSKKERDYYIYLKSLEDQMKIFDLKTQTKFFLQKGFVFKGKKVQPITYKADFTYYDKQGNYHVVDAKGLKTQVYLIKKKMMAYVYQIEVEEV